MEALMSWVMSSCLFWISVSFFSKDLKVFFQAFSVSREKKTLEKVISHLREIEELLAAGLVPEPRHWKEIQLLPFPWGTLTYESLNQLRGVGGAMVPTLRRLRALSEEQAAAILQAHSRCSQAYSQAFVCACLVPVFGTLLFYLVPSITQAGLKWGLACLLSFFGTVASSVWMVQLSLSARWGGLRVESRSWILSSLCAGERFLALVRAGVPPDLAWAQGMQFLQKETVELSRLWGASIWQTSSERRKGLEQTLLLAGQSMKKAIQVSLMEGRPSVDRVESVLFSLGQDIRAQVERELSLLPTRVLVPLFVGVAPSILGLLGYGFYWMSRGVWGEF